MMKNQKLKLIATFLLGLCLTGLQAQQAFPSTGGSALGSGGSACYTIGQIAYTTQTGTTGSMSQGVQQPYEISVVSGLNQMEDIKLSFAVYPNPTTDILVLRVENYNNLNLSYELFDLYGRLLEHLNITGQETTIAMGHLDAATYILKVSSNNNIVKSFKIIKHQTR